MADRHDEAPPAGQRTYRRVDLWQCVHCEARGLQHYAVVVHEPGVRTGDKRRLVCPRCDRDQKVDSLPLFPMVHRFLGTVDDIDVEQDGGSQGASGARPRSGAQRP